MPRVMRIINRLNLGGPTYNAGYLTRHLAPEFETMLVSGMKDETEESSEFIIHDLGIEPVYIPEMHRSINPLRDYSAYRRIKKLMQEFKPDIVHTHASKSGTLGRLAAIAHRVPVIIHTFHGHVFHSYFNPIKTRIFIHIERYLAQHSDAIIAISDIQKHELGTVHGICEPEKITVIPLGFDLDRFTLHTAELRKEFRHLYNIPENIVAVGILGRLVPVKNHKLFLTAFADAQAHADTPVVAVIIGDGESREETRMMAEELGFKWNDTYEQGQTKQVVFTSWMKRAELAIAGLDVIALSSLNEGTPVSLIEAQAGGKPVVSTRVGGIGNVVIEGVSGFLSAVDDSAGMANNILQLVNNPELREQMGIAGHTHVANRYHFTRLVTETANLYNTLLARKAFR